MSEQPIGRRDRAYRQQRDEWRRKFFSLAAAVVAGGNLGLLDLLDHADVERVRTEALALLDRVR